MDRHSISSPEMRPGPRIRSISQLPTNLLHYIVDHLSVPDMFQFARTCLHNQDIVYNDARWVRRLEAMGCWNEADAKSQNDQRWQEKIAAQKLKKSGKHTPKSSIHVRSDESPARSPPLVDTTPPSDTDVGSAVAPEWLRTAEAAKQPLLVLHTVRSVHGNGRASFGRVYASLAPFYFDITRSSASNADKLIFRRFSDPEEQAWMFRQLDTFSLADWSLGYHDRRSRLHNATSSFENSVLQEFEHALDQEDYDVLARRNAAVLEVLNGGSVAIDLFLQKRQVALLDSIRDQPSDCFNIHAQTLNLAPLELFIWQIAARVNAQIPLIERVFGKTRNVFLPLVERIAEETVSEYLESLFDHARGISTANYIQVVSASFDLCVRLSRSLDVPKGSPADVRIKCERAFYFNFEPQAIEYIDGEHFVFAAQAKELVEAWERRLQESQEQVESPLRPTVNRQVAKNNFIAAFKQVVMLPVNAVSALPFPAFSSSEVSVATAEVAVADQVESEQSELAAQAAIVNSRLSGMNSLISIELAVKLTQLAKGCVDRIARFTALKGEIGQQAKIKCEKVFVSLMDVLGKQHVDTGYANAIDRLASYQPRSLDRTGTSGSRPEVEPLVMFIELVNIGDLIQQMVDVFYQQELVAAKLTHQDDFLSFAGKEKRRFEKAIDERVASGLNLGIDVLMSEVEFVCGTVQKPTDFNPGSGLPMADLGSAVSDCRSGLTTFSDSGLHVAAEIRTTEAAERIVSLVKGHLQMLVGSTEQSMLDVFNQEVGLRLFSALCKHIKRQRISEDGAITMICDLKHYYDFVSTLRNRNLNEYFAALRQVAQLYLVPGPGRPDLGLANRDGRGSRNSVVMADKESRPSGSPRPASVSSLPGSSTSSTPASATKPNRSSVRSSLSLSLFSKPKPRFEGAADLAALIADHDRYAGVFSPEEVYQFAARRLDWLDIKPDVERAMYGVGCTVM